MFADLHRLMMARCFYYQPRAYIDVPMLLTRMAEEISCRAQDSNSTAENDDL